MKSNDTFIAEHFYDGDNSVMQSLRSFGRTKKAAKDSIDKIQRAAGKGNTYFVKENEESALCGFYSMDSITCQARIWVKQSEKVSKTEKATDSKVFPENSSDLFIDNIHLNTKPDTSFLTKIISFLLYEGFYNRKLHKISLCTKENNFELINILEMYQWKQEGCLVDYYYENDKYVNGVLYAILENDFSLYSVGMVPFLNGYLIMQTTNNAVFDISIIKEGDEVPSFISNKCEFINQISENNKIIKSENMDIIHFSKKAYPYLIFSLNQLLEYVKGKRSKFDLLFEYSSATDFQKSVWEATKKIPFGQTRTYEEISNIIKPNGTSSDLRLLSRAVGTALGKNPVMIAIPCHRVIGKNGKLKGFAGGLEIKDYLLSHEMLFFK